MSPKGTSGLPARLRAERHRRGLFQRHIAAMAGVTSVTVSRWELGKEKPRLAHLVKLAEGLGYPLSWFKVGPDAGEELSPLLRVYRFEVTLHVGEAGEPDGAPDGLPSEISRSFDNRDPHSYAVQVTTASLMPFFLPGDVLEVVTNLEPRVGDAVIVYLRDGPPLIRAVVAWVRERLTLDSLNRTEPTITLARDHVQAVHRIMSIRRRAVGL